MITNSDGFVALQHYNSNPRTVKIQADGTLYSFVPRHSVSLAWIDPKHVDSLLAQKAKLCCGKNQNLFFPASQINVNIWTTGTREGEENA